MAVELATGYVSIVPSARGFGGHLRRQLGPQTSQAGAQLGQQMSRSLGGRLVDGMAGVGSRISSGLNTAFQVGGVVAGGVLAKSIVGGVNRALALEEAGKRFTSMGLGIADVDTLMSSLNDTLTGTPYALDAGATALSNWVATGMDLERIPKIFDMITDATAFGQGDLLDVSRVFERIWLEGEASSMRMMQLATRGLPVYAMLADALEMTGEELRKFVADGKLDAETFFAAWEKGAQGFGEQNIRMAGSAQSAGDTTRGAWMNMWNAFYRFGERLSGPVLNQAQRFFTGVGRWVDELAKSPAIEAVTERLEGIFDSPAFARFDTWLSNASTHFERIRSKVADLGPALGPILGLFTAGGFSGLAGMLGPLSGLLGPLARLNPMVGVLFGLFAQSPELRAAVGKLFSAMQPLLVALGGDLAKSLSVLAEAAIPVLVAGVEALVPPMEWLADHASIVSPILLGLGAAALLIAHPMLAVGAAILAIGAGLLWAYENVEWFRDGVNKAKELLSRFAETVSRVAGEIADAWRADGFDGVKRWLANAWPDIWRGIKDIGKKGLRLWATIAGKWWGLLGRGIKAAAEWMLREAPGWWEAIGQAISTAGEWLFDEGLPALWRTVAGWISRVAPELWHRLQEDWAPAFKNWLGEHYAPYLEKMWGLLGRLGTWIVADALPFIQEKLREWARAFAVWVITQALPWLLPRLAALLGRLGTWILTVALPYIQEKLREWARAFAVWVITDGIPLLLEKLAELRDAIGRWITDTALPALRDKAAEWFGALKDKAQEKGEEALDWLKGLPGKIGAWIIATAMPALKSKAAEWFGVLRTAAQEKGAELVSWMSRLPSKVVSALGDLSLALWDAGMELIAGFIGGIKAKATEIAEAVESAVGVGVAAAKSALRINSPSRVFLEIGGSVGEGLALGISQSTGLAERAAGRLSAATAAAFVVDPSLRDLGTPRTGATAGPKAAAPAAIRVIVTPDREGFADLIDVRIEEHDGETIRMESVGDGRHG